MRPTCDQARIHVHFPTRGRPEQAVHVLSRLRTTCQRPDLLSITIVLDADDAASLRQLERLRKLGEVKTAPAGGTKIMACNFALPDPASYDIIVLGSDDMHPVAGWDTIARHHMGLHWPHYDGALQFHDGSTSEILTYPVYGARYAATLRDRQGLYLYPRGYRSVFADNEATLIAARLGRLASCGPVQLFTHVHPDLLPQMVKRDRVHELNDANWLHDQTLWEMRRYAGPTAPEPLLSVLICGVDDPRRNEHRHVLIEQLYAQAERHHSHGAVEIRCMVDAGYARGGLYVGAKRRSLVNEARGRYVCFVDDDDVVSDRYIAKLLHELGAMVSDASDQRATVGRGPDVVTFDVLMMARSPASEDPRGEERPASAGWNQRELFHICARSSEDGPRTRIPNHLCPVRRELAKEAGFGDENCGEDHAYARRLRPLCSTYRHVPGEPIYVYMYDPAATLTQTVPEGRTAAACAGAADTHA